MPRAPREAYGKFGKYIRWHIVALHYDCGMDEEGITSQLNGPASIPFISVSSVRRILNTFFDTSDVITPKAGKRRPRRRRKISADIWDFIISCLILNPTFFLYELQDLVETNYGKHIPLSTLCANLNREGWTVRVLQQRCTQRCIEDEAHWRSMQQDYDARMFMFTDFCHTNPKKRHRCHGRGQRGQRKQALCNWTWGKNISVMGVL